MTSRITRWVVGIVAAIGMVAVSIGVIGNATAQSAMEQVQTPPKKDLTNRYETQSSELDFRLGDHQQLRRMFLNGSRDRLK